jgi:hypothetical protein
VHGQLARNLDDKPVDKEHSYGQTKFEEIKEETESTTVAAQDQAITTNCFENKVLREGHDSKCRVCE